MFPFISILFFNLYTDPLSFSTPSAPTIPSLCSQKMKINTVLLLHPNMSHHFLPRADVFTAHLISSTIFELISGFLGISCPAPWQNSLRLLSLQKFCKIILDGYLGSFVP